MGVGFAELVFGIALEQERRIPAADEVESVSRQHAFQRRDLARKLVAELHALESGGLGFRQALFERDFPAQFAHVVVRPPDGVGADPYGHRSSLR